MNIFSAISDATKVIEQGKAIKFSTILTNAEAGGVMIYSFLSAVVILLQDLGVDVHIGATDLHTLSNGWAITAGFVYSIYRIATNPAAGVAPKSE
jgi:hypothetical protein